MRIKLLIISLVLLVLAVAMFAPVAAQNDVTVHEDTYEYNEGGWTEAVNHQEWRFVMGALDYLLNHTEDTWGVWWDETVGTYDNAFSADYGGGTGQATTNVTGESWGASDTSTTVDTMSNPAPGVVEGSHTEVDTTEDWWSEFESDSTTTWTPS